MTFEELLDMVKDEDYTLDLDEGQVELHYAGDEFILATIGLGDVPDEMFAKICRDMIVANYMFQGTAGATLSLEPGTHRAYLHRLFCMPVEREEGFLNHLAVLIRNAGEWKERISGSGADEPLLQEPMLDSNFFIRV
ncbi:MAG: type III secretion system chaperone [Victivallales bacterium]|nr:type III secretion system chaperone [Victivallales bacterium]